MKDLLHPDRHDRDVFPGADRSKPIEVEVGLDLIQLIDLVSNTCQTRDFMILQIVFNRIVTKGYEIECYQGSGP